MSPGKSGFTVVVGVSTTSTSPGALTWAVAEAAARGGSVVAVRAWRPVTPTSSGTRPPLQTYDAETAYAGERERLSADVAAVLGPDHQVECRLVEGGRRKVLLKQARDADLLVVDAPRQTELSGGVFFAHRLVYAAPCPVVIMPPSVSGLGPTGLAKAGRKLGEEVVRAAGTAGRPGVRPPFTSGDPSDPQEG